MSGIDSWLSVASRVWRHRVGLSSLGLLVLGLGFARAAASAGPSSPARTASGAQAPAPRPTRTLATLQQASTSGPVESEPASPFVSLSPLSISNVQTRETVALRLYDSAGNVDETQAAKLDALLCDTRKREHPATVLDRRVLQLLYRAAYHFAATRVEVVSAYRQAGRRREGMHALGRAIDFKLPGVKAAALAAYLRTLPRVGVGVYTHPKTQFAHLDVRDRSFYWLDASPPGRRWREQSLGQHGIEARDAKYTRNDDWPEGLNAPAPAGGAEPNAAQVGGAPPYGPM